MPPLRERVFAPRKVGKFSQHIGLQGVPVEFRIFAHFALLVSPTWSAFRMGFHIALVLKAA